MKRFLLFLPLILAACATPQEQVHIAGTESPRLMRGLVTTDKTVLPVQSWLPRGRPKAVIVAVHGFNDYNHAFAMPGEILRRNGIALYAYDQRGFGRAGSVGVWPGENNLTRDVADMVRAVKKRNPHIPLYLLGESMGGSVAIAAVVRPGFPPIDGLILSAPAVWGGDTMNPFYRAALWTFAHTWPTKTMTGEDLHILASDNIPMLRAFSTDPLVIKETRVDSIYGLVHIMDAGYTNIGKVKVPMLVLYGAHDEVIPPAPTAKALHKVTAPHVFAYYPHGYHMLLRDLHRDAPIRDIMAWVSDKQEPLPSGADRAAQEFLK